MGVKWKLGREICPNPSIGVSGMGGFTLLLRLFGRMRCREVTAVGEGVPWGWSFGGLMEEPRKKCRSLWRKLLGGGGVWGRLDWRQAGIFGNGIEWGGN